jgi:ABC-type multidrug transport system fused ATPase/permease subunit
MNRKSRKVISFLFRITQNNHPFFFWLFVRFVSAILPLVALYQFAGVIHQLETKEPINSVLIAILWILVNRLLDNILRLKSVTRLEYEIAHISSDIHNYFLVDLKSESKDERHAAVQAIRNFSDAASITLNLIKQPGIDGLVSIIFIPIIIFTLDFHIFILMVAYILVYYFVDYYTTQRYARLKDTVNNKTENYYAKLQDSSDFDLEQNTLNRHFNRLCHWGETEWSFLQNLSVVFYIITFLYLVTLTINGNRDLANVVLIMSYVSQTQVFLNNFSSIQDSLTDMLVGLERLAQNKSVSAVSLEDLI